MLKRKLVNLPDDMWVVYEELAKEKGLSVSAYIRMLLMQNPEYLQKKK